MVFGVKKHVGIKTNQMVEMIYHMLGLNIFESPKMKTPFNGWNTFSTCSAAAAGWPHCCLRAAQGGQLGLLRLGGVPLVRWMWIQKATSGKNMWLNNVWQNDVWLICFLYQQLNNWFCWRLPHDQSKAMLESMGCEHVKHL